MASNITERENALKELQLYRDKIENNPIPVRLSKVFDGAPIIELELAIQKDELVPNKSMYLIGAVNYLAGNALNTGNKVHYDQENGGEGEWLPSELQKMYPDVNFKFTGRGEKGVDVEVLPGPNPSDSETNPMNWQPGNDFGDFKPGTYSGWKTFLKDINKGKIPVNSEYLPYDPETGKLIKPEPPIEGVKPEPPVEGGEGVYLEE